MTYNHERYIEACLASVLTQGTDFDFEVVVGDDCSTDGTRAILERLSDEHPQRLRVISHPINIGPTQNLLATHNAARGEYVASLDGDDMAHPEKLARQAALLDSTPNLVACGHRMRLIDEAGSPDGRYYPARLSATFDIGKVIRCGMPVFASSIMYRSRARNLRASDFELFDWFILTDILKAGDAGYISDALGSYRINQSSLTSQMKVEAMQVRMLGLYQIRLLELPKRKADFFAYSVRTALLSLVRRIPITVAHRRLLRESSTLLALRELTDTVAWVLQNKAALER